MIAHSNHCGGCYLSISTSVVVQLARGDDVDVYCGSKFNNTNPYYTFFSGFLNKAD